MPFLDTNGASIFYETQGDSGHWVTLINGHTRTSSDFRIMTRQLVETGLFRVLLMDNRASGKSNATEPFALTDMCDDVTRLWQELHIAKSHVVGISMGGVIAQGLAIESPNHVARLVLISSAPDEGFIRPVEGAWSVNPTLLEKRMRSYFAPGFVERNPLLFSTMIKQIQHTISNGRFQENSEMQRAALRGTSWMDRLQEISAQTLLIHGDMDGIVDPAASKLMHERIHHSKLVLLPGVGHLLLAESPKQLYKEVTEFLTGQE